MTMRLALIRQRYTPFGGAERFVESALEALLERNVAITLYTREWPKTRLQLIEPHIVDPWYLGRLWRDLGFARAVTHEVGRAKLDLVQSHERVLCCDVYRAGDGVHAVWLDERLRRAGVLRRLGVRLSLWHRYILATERKLFGSPWLQAVICNSAMVRDEIRERFGVPEAKLRVVYNAVDSQAFSPALRQHRAAVRAKHRHRRRRHRVPAGGLRLRAQGGRHRDGGALRAAAAGAPPGRRPREAPRALPQAGAQAGRRLARDAGRSAGGSRSRTSGPPTPSSCRPSTTRSPTPRWKRWRARCPW